MILFKFPSPASQWAQSRDESPAPRASMSGELRTGAPVGEEIGVRTFLAVSNGRCSNWGSLLDPIMDFCFSRSFTTSASVFPPFISFAF